ncbi:hypothetical protein [Glutamicibacter sp.]|uniref:hypothetical protein n=1 Tax=Glutamicibacter sp. TaxID=1931995 RepID=UPI0028BE6FDD|nr:hypothetical protein [Glutamicibacter sp.]
MTPAKSSPRSTLARLRKLASQIAAQRERLNILLFTLDVDLPNEEIARQLQGQLGRLDLAADVATAGPERVRSAIDGKFDDVDVLVVLANSGSEAEDRLMELVQWLLANGRTSLAQNLVFAQWGSSRRQTSPIFDHVVLEDSYVSQIQQSGRRFPWAAASHESWNLADAVLSYAVGLRVE